MKKYRNKWWSRLIRFMNWFSFRYWWFVWLVFLAVTVLWFYFCWRKTEDNFSCNNRESIEKIIKAKNSLDSCCNCKTRVDTIIVRDSVNHGKIKDSVPQQPKKNCRVHFSDLVMGDRYEESYVSKIYEIDNFSEYVGSGYYPDNMYAFPRSASGTFDGIAIDRGTHLIIYERPNFKGKILLDVIGPKLVFNVFRKNHPKAIEYFNKVFARELQINYPQEVRIWSNSNMNNWKNGSCKIFCNNE